LLATTPAVLVASTSVTYKFLLPTPAGPNGKLYRQAPTASNSRWGLLCPCPKACRIGLPKLCATSGVRLCTRLYARVQKRTHEAQLLQAIVRFCTRRGCLCAKTDMKHAMFADMSPFLHTARTGVCKSGRVAGVFCCTVSVSARGEVARVQKRTHHARRATNVSDKACSHDLKAGSYELCGKCERLCVGSPSISAGQQCNSLNCV
jgi:hypothetical protein